MKSLLQAGVCVSCGRGSGWRYRTCPYCGEQVWQPLGWRVARMTVFALPPLCAAALVAWSHPDWAALAQAAQSVSPMRGFLFSAGIGLLCLPCSDGDLIVSSHAELLRWQAQAVAGALLCGAYAAVAAIGLCFGRVSGAGVWSTACVMGACVLAAPFFFRIPWRALVAAALVVAAIALG